MSFNLQTKTLEIKLSLLNPNEKFVVKLLRFSFFIFLREFSNQQNQKLSPTCFPWDFVDNRSLRRHKETLPAKWFECDNYGFHSWFFIDLNNHAREKHDSAVVCDCVYCRETYTEKAVFDEQLIAAHGKPNWLNLRYLQDNLCPMDQLSMETWQCMIYRSRMILIYFHTLLTLRRSQQGHCKPRQPPEGSA